MTGLAGSEIGKNSNEARYRHVIFKFVADDLMYSVRLLFIMLVITH